MSIIENFNRFVLSNLEVLLSGLWVTTYVCFWAFLLALLLGAVICFIRLRIPYLRIVAIGYVEFFRATPILVQLLWVNYVWPAIFGFPQTVTGAGILALALQSSGYLAETFRAGLEGLPKGQREAALAVGMSRWRVTFRVELPQVALVVAPVVINQLAVVVKSSTLVSVIAIADLMYEGLKVVNQWYEPIEVLTTIALAYFALIFAISTVANYAYVHFQTKFGITTQR
jgi:polar amino acid transport system permease protein